MQVYCGHSEKGEEECMFYQIFLALEAAKGITEESQYMKAAGRNAASSSRLYKQQFLGSAVQATGCSGSEEDP